jgi:hypothetical protein
MTLAAALIKVSFLACSLFGTLQAESLIPIFTPPKGWDLVENPSTKVKKGFVFKNRRSCSPTLNFTSETLISSTQEYLRSLEKLYTSHSDHRFRKLGTLKTRAGSSQLISLDMATAAGKIRVLQSILFKNNKAYILTGAIPLEEFSSYQEEVLKTFSSFDLVENLEDYIQDDQKKELFCTKIHSPSPKESDSSLRLLISKEFAQEGLYWQSLAIEKFSKK